VPSPGSAFELIPLQPAHVGAAASLVSARFRQLRAVVAVLPEAWAMETTLARIIGELVSRGAGSAAIRAGELIGFQAATLIDGHGGRWSYTPDVGHATAALDAADVGRVTEALYASLAERWVREACPEHVVTVFADDVTALAAFARLGFGQSVIDLVRDLSPVAGAAPVVGVSVRRAGPEDAARIQQLDLGLRSHLAAPPVFLRQGAAAPVEIQRRSLADPGIATFLAEVDGAPVAFLRIGPSATDVATIVRDPGTASITGAFTAVDRRSGGIATWLLDAAARWAAEAGYVRMAVDHESANGEAVRFWARHFTPATISLSRRLPPRIAA
jgi:GNAT superfamily N-acetyltransferase